MTEQGPVETHSEMRLDRARDLLDQTVAPSEKTETCSVSNADGRVLSTEVSAQTNVPHYERAAMDGFALLAADTTDASRDTPATFEVTTGDVTPGEAIQVHTGSKIPPGADAVVRVEQVETTRTGIRVEQRVPEGNDIAPIGEDVEEGQHLYDPGHRLRPSDLGLLKSAGVREISVYTRPTVCILPTGEEIVERDPEPGEVVETNGLMVSHYVDRWGGRSEIEDTVTDDEHSLAHSIQKGCDADLVVTIGGTSAGERDLIPVIVNSLGDLLVRSVAIKPGHPVGIGVIDGTPVLLLPGYPVSCIVTAVQLLRPALSYQIGTRPRPLPTVRATLTDSIESAEGTRRYMRIQLHSDATDRNTAGSRHDPTGIPALSPDELQATPTHSGAGVLSSVVFADGWVEIPEETEVLEEGTAVTVQDWEWYP